MKQMPGHRAPLRNVFPENPALLHAKTPVRPYPEPPKTKKKANILFKNSNNLAFCIKKLGQQLFSRDFVHNNSKIKIAGFFTVFN